MDFQLTILPWEEFFLIQPCVYAIVGEAGVESLHGVAVRVGMAEKDFERTFWVGHLVSRRNGLVRLYGFHLIITKSLQEFRRISVKDLKWQIMMNWNNTKPVLDY